MSSTVVVKPAVIMNSVALDRDVEAGEIGERRLMGAWPAGHLPKGNEELQYYLDHSGKTETLSIFSLIVSLIYIILKEGNSPTQTPQADLLLADLRKEGGQGTPPPLDVNATCHVFIIIFKRKKLLVCLLESYYECFA